MDAEKLKKKLYIFKTPLNCGFLTTKKCNTEIWSLQMNEQQRSNDLKVQKLQNSLVKGTIAVAQLTDAILKLHRDKDLTPKGYRKALSGLLGMASDSVALLAQTHQMTNDFRRRKITYAFGQNFKGLDKNVDEKSEWLFGDDISKKVTELKNHQKTFQNTNNSSSYSSKNYQRSSKYPRGQGRGYYRQKFRSENYRKQQFSNSKNKFTKRDKKN